MRKMYLLLPYIVKMMKKNIALVAGGDSGEYEISIKSGIAVKKNINPDLYNVYPIVIKGDTWLYKGNENEISVVDKNDFSIKIADQKINFDCVFIAIHGSPGEDGKLPGYFDLLNIPYTSCDMFTSSAGFKKNFTNCIVSSFNIQTAKSLTVKDDSNITLEKIVSEIQMPCFVKPVRSGSSVGVSKVAKVEQLPAAMQKAFAEDNEILIEEAIIGREIACGVIKSLGKTYVLPLCEIVTHNEFFDYEAKYTEGKSVEIVPAPLSAKEETLCKVTSSFLYEQLNCKGVVRFDYILTGKGLFFLEMNTVPGFTEESIIPKMVREMGWNVSDLYSMLIEDALACKKA
jgi:D-alanine-D-alanine ligase